MKKWIKITSIVTAVIAVIVLAVAVSIAPLAKNYIEKHDRELLGRSIRLDSFDMRMRLWPLLSNRVVVKKLSFAAPGIKVYQRGNSFSFDDILAHFAGDTIPAAATPEKPSKPWEIGIYDISIRNGQVFYKDLLLDATWGMKDINLHIPGVYFSGENLWSWSPLYRHTKDYDVTVITKGSDNDLTSGNKGDGFNYPTMRNLSLGISITY